MKDAVQLLRDVVRTARPSFPGTPFRVALDEARAFLKEADNAQEEQAVEVEGRNEDAGAWIGSPVVAGSRASRQPRHGEALPHEERER